MKKILITIIFQFLFSCLFSQKKYFKLKEENELSFYDKGVVKCINQELKKYVRNRFNTAFVYIDDKEDTLITCFIYFRSHKKVNFTYFLFNTKKDIYYRAEIYPDKIELPKIESIYTYINDSKNLEEDSSLVIFDKYSCNLYIKLGIKEKQIWISSTKLNNDFGFILSRNSYQLTNFFVADGFNKEKSKLDIFNKWSVLHFKSEISY